MGELKESFKGFSKVYIQTHNFPDADAIASAYGMKRLFEEFGMAAEIVYYGSSILKSNISKLVDKFYIRMTIIGEGFEIAENELLLVVDGQYGSGNVKAVKASNIAVIDHHLKENSNSYIYADIQPRIGACSTLVFNYLKCYDVKIDEALATIMYYGIFMDTDMFTGKVTTIDDDARKELSSICDKRFIEYLRFSSLSFDDLRVYAQAIQKIERYNNIIFSYIEECDDNLLGHISDLLLEIDDIDIVVVFSQRSNGYKLSIRSYHQYLTAEELTKEITKGVGSGGGNINKAGGYIFEDRFKSLHKNMSFGIYIKTCIIDYCREVKLLVTGANNPYEEFGKEKFFKAKKRKCYYRYIELRDHFQEDVSIKTLEGLATASMKDKVIIGVKTRFGQLLQKCLIRSIIRFMTIMSAVSLISIWMNMV
jgi:Exopolyphosphatase-related proteins